MKGRGWGGISWKIVVLVILGLILIAAISRRKPAPPTIVYKTLESAQQTLKNCTTPATNVSCNCPPAAPNITDGASSDGVLRLANKVTSTTVDNILDAASSKNPTEQTVRVRTPYFQLVLKSNLQRFECNETILSPADRVKGLHIFLSLSPICISQTLRLVPDYLLIIV